MKLALADLDCLPEREGERLAEILGENEALSFAHDGCERRRRRPKDKDMQKEYYSGKKKAHTLQNHLVAHSESRRICYLSKTVPGKKHDKKLADESEIQYPPLSTLEQDTGFQGFEPTKVIVLQPTKKPKGREPTYKVGSLPTVNNSSIVVSL